MRKIKIRHAKRILRAIQAWRDRNVNLDLLASMAEYKSQRDYVKFRISPWSGINLRNARLTEPRGKIRAALIQALLDIHDSWKAQLDRAGQTYDLRIWLFHPHISSSQIVVDIDGEEFFRNDFSPATATLAFPFSQFGKFAARLAEMERYGCIEDFNVDDPARLDPSTFDSTAAYMEERRYLERLMPRVFSSHTYIDHLGLQQVLHFIAIGQVWVCRMA